MSNFFDVGNIGSVHIVGDIKFDIATRQNQGVATASRVGGTQVVFPEDSRGHGVLVELVDRHAAIAGAITPEVPHMSLLLSTSRLLPLLKTMSEKMPELFGVWIDRDRADRSSIRSVPWHSEE